MFMPMLHDAAHKSQIYLDKLDFFRTSPSIVVELMNARKSYRIRLMCVEYKQTCSIVFIDFEDDEH
ncbi:CLUMA_CG011200, isoform A [Clunio marinus]|uniref:CLUMA_CG011200, isoform A n=1 Tax=Clunio marinus TaxID=568069 RepID=A0A1J1IC71_9DIPT|nr:CLUMA_CG011200, isoform A [Clunio marinus]